MVINLPEFGLLEDEMSELGLYQSQRLDHSVLLIGTARDVSWRYCINAFDGVFLCPITVYFLNMQLFLRVQHNLHTELHGVTNSRFRLLHILNTTTMILCGYFLHYAITHLKSMLVVVFRICNKGNWLSSRNHQVYLSRYRGSYYFQTFVFICILNSTLIPYSNKKKFMET
jgi:hypothetical protein